MNLPAAFEEKMRALLGDEFDEYIACYEEPRYYGMRVNTGKISVEEFEKICPFEIRKIPWIENGFYYDGDKVSPAKHPYYFAGLYYLQEPSAMTPANRLPVERGMCVYVNKHDRIMSKITGRRRADRQRYQQIESQGTA